MNFVSVIGTLATVLTVACFVPQVVQVVKTKQARDISLSMYVLFIIGLCLWIVYSLFARQVPVLVTNGSILILAIIILYYKIKFG